jgi:uncharacterized DUF497 family protein
VETIWDVIKAAMNLRKHGVRFEEAITIFDDPLVVDIEDPWHSYDEERLFAIGQSSSGKLLVVTYVVRGDETRLITARRATTTERRRYMRGDSIRDEGEEPEIDLSDIPEIDFTNGVRGRAYRGPREIRFVSIDEDVARYFSTSDAVNKALRELIKEGRAPEPRTESATA